MGVIVKVCINSLRQL